MPQAVVAAALTTALEVGIQVAIGEIAFGQIAMTALAKTFAKHLLFTALMGALNRSKEPALNVEAQQRKQSIRSSISPRKFIYGRARASGTLAYAGSSGTDNEYLHLVIPMHHGEMTSVETIYLNDEESTATRFGANVRANIKLGLSSQTVDSDLDAESVDWTTAHRLRGIGYIYLRLRFDATAFPTGIPNPSAILQGRKVYDPRTETVGWSNNPALCILDYLTGRVDTATGDEPIGIGADRATEVDIDTFIAAANICDEEVEIAAGGTHARYTCDGVVQLDASPAAIMEQLLTCCAGALVYAGGVYRLFVGAPTAATFTITADMLRGPVRYRPYQSKRDGFNGVRGTYVDPLNSYEATDFPSQVSTTYVAEDGGEQRLLDLQLPYTQDGVRAQRLAKQFLERNRLGAEIELQCNFSALGIAVWDTGYVDIEDIGFSSTQKWRVKSWTFAEGGGVDLTLQEEDDAAYDWDTADEVTPEEIPRPSMVRADQVEAPTGVAGSSASYITPEGSAVGGILVEWTQAADAFVVGYEVQYSETTADNWLSAASVGLVASAQINFLTVGTAYDVRVRAVRGGGATSEWVQDTGITVSGDASAPAAPSGVSATGLSGAIKVDWTFPSDSDLRLARLYRNTTNNSAGASAIADIYGLPGQAGTYTDTVATGQTRYYWLKARDLSGNLSGSFSSGVNATAS